jgi:GNAT superfamily N-acetyltransferase
MPDETVTIDELTIPRSTDDPAYRNFVRFIDVGNANRERIFGTPLLNLDAANMVAFLQDQTWFQQRLFTARRDGRIVATAMLRHEGREATPVAWLGVTVHPAWRCQGIGTALAGHVERRASEAGYTTFQVFANHTTIGEERIAPPTGYGDVPLTDPGVRFLLRRGYTLEQVGRISVLDLPVDPELLAFQRAEAEAAAGPDYRAMTWAGSAPHERLDDIALLHSRMFTDAPFAAMERDTTPWDAARVRAEEDTAARSGRILLTAAVEHRPTGLLVAFSQLQIPRDRARPVSQGATLVLEEHRGHRLGRLVKVVNIQELARVSPGSRMIQTDNAEENRHMLRVNDEVGFRAIGYAGMWKRSLAR